jgi:hypothetical protein
MEDFRTAWLLDANTSTGAPTISKFTRPSDTTPFTAAAGYPVSGFTVAVGGVPTTVYDGRGLTGMVDAADGTTLRLYFTSSVGLVRYTPSDGSFALLARPCDTSGTMRFQGIAPAPFVPSPAPTTSPSASLTASASATISAGAVPSSTATPTNTATTSTSLTATPTSTATPPCARLNAAGAPFAFGNLAAVRIGIGRSPLPGASPAVAVEAIVDELTPGGVLVQSFGLPGGGPAYHGSGFPLSAGCTISSGTVGASQLSRAGDGRTLALVCHPMPVGENLVSGANKTIRA